MTSKTSITYGGALYDLAKDEGLSAQILADLGAFAAVFRENPDYRRLLTEPSIPKAEREALLDEAWKDALHPYTLNFVKLLCANGTVSQLPDCETVYRARYNEDNNILAVTAVSAALPSEVSQAISFPGSFRPTAYRLPSASASARQTDSSSERTASRFSILRSVSASGLILCKRHRRYMALSRNPAANRSSSAACAILFSNSLSSSGSASFLSVSR